MKFSWSAYNWICHFSRVIILHMLPWSIKGKQYLKISNQFVHQGVFMEYETCWKFWENERSIYITKFRRQPLKWSQKYAYCVEQLLMHYRMKMYSSTLKIFCLCAEKATYILTLNAHAHWCYFLKNQILEVLEFASHPIPFPRFVN